MSFQENPYLMILKRHFDPVLKMMKNAIDYCPEHLWNEAEEKILYWQQIYHAVFFVDFWFRHNYSRGVEYRSMVFDQDIFVELNKRSDEFLTKDELRAYLDKVKDKVERYFANLNDAKLLETIVPDSDFTYFDTILCQIRHVQYHVASCNSMLKKIDTKTVEWQGYNEG